MVGMSIRLTPAGTLFGCESYILEGTQRIPTGDSNCQCRLTVLPSSRRNSAAVEQARVGMGCNVIFQAGLLTMDQKGCHDEAFLEWWQRSGVHS
jgi:hypothetical protein